MAPSSSSSAINNPPWPAAPMKLLELWPPAITVSQLVVVDSPMARSSSSIHADVLSTLGHGGFGHVYKVRLLHGGTCSSSSSTAAALKVFTNDNLLQMVWSKREIRKEIEISLGLSQKAWKEPGTPIVRSLQAHTMKGSAMKEVLGLAGAGGGHVKSSDEEEDVEVSCMSMELCEGGDLEDVLEEIGGIMKEEAAAAFFYPVAQAIQFCHSHRILHLDVKPRNVMFRKKGKLETACLGDFSLAMRMPSDMSTVSIASLSDGLLGHPGIGTHNFMAPEVQDDGLFSPLADVFSLGCLLLYALTGFTFSWRYYFSSWRDDVMDVHYVESVLSDMNHPNTGRKAWAKLSPPAKHLIAGMLCPNPLLRFNISQVLCHPWLEAHVPRRPHAWTSFKKSIASSFRAFRDTRLWRNPNRK